MVGTDESTELIVISGLFYVLFSFFSNTNTISAQQINMKNESSSMRYWDSNSRPHEHESPPLTTRPGLLISLTALRRR